jgi:hypothetical protein
VKIDITHTLKDADAVLKALPRDIFNAQRSAERDTVRFAKNQTQNRIIERTGVPARVFRRIKGRIRTKNTQKLGVVWLGFNEIAAAYLGRLQQTRTGARAGKFFFEGGFIATMKSGKKSAWYRTGGITNTGKPEIKEHTAEINVGYEVMADVAKLAEIELKAKFREHVLRLNPHLS